MAYGNDPEATSGGYGKDPEAGTASPKTAFNTELTWAEKNIAPILERFGLNRIADGNIRGSSVGRAAMGAADPGVAIWQMLANAPGSDGAVANKGIADTEAQYQAARESAGSTGFDPMRLAGNVAITAPVALGGATTVTRGALQGAGFGALNPVTSGDFATEKAKQVGTGALGGAIAAPIIGGLSRLIQPKVNPNVQILQSEGVRPTVGQAAGGMLNTMEEKAQAIPFFGDAIRAARARPVEQLEGAAFGRSGGPIGAKIQERGHEGILELKDALSNSYDKVIPKLSADMTDPAFVGKMQNLRSLVSSLPQKEQERFDAVIAREIDQRLAPNGKLSGQNLKDAWNALRDEAAKFSKSTDAYQQDLGRAFKQTFEELKTHVAATNPADVVRDLRNTDLGYANFKILQKAASGVNAVDGRISPSALQSAVKASDRSLDKGRFSERKALMQDLSNAGKDVLANKVPDSGTAGRLMSNTPGLILGAAMSPLALGYTPAVQNALVALMTKRPDMAPQIANALRQLSGPATAGAAMAQQ